MQSQFEAANPDQIQFTLTVTMTLSDWRHLREQLKEDQSQAGWELRNRITDMILQAQQTFYPKATP